jgi:hypothetical protein
VAHEHLEQLELLRGQRDLRVAAAHPARGRVEHEVADAQLGAAVGRPAAHERAQPGQQLAEVERLDQVVVGAGVQPLDAVLDRIAGGEHEDRRAHALVAQPAAGLEAVQPRQHHVEDDDVVRRGAGHPQRVLAADRDVGEQALLAQPLPDQGGQLHLVLDDQHPHVPRG